MDAFFALPYVHHEQLNSGDAVSGKFIFDSSNPEVVKAMGNLLESQGFFYKAKAIYERFLMTDPENIMVLTKLANVLVKLEKLDEAKMKFEEALKIDPKNVLALVGLAAIFLAQGDLKQAELKDTEAKEDYINAEKKYVEALASQPHDAPALRGFARTLNRLNRNSEAMDQLRLAIIEDPDDQEIDAICREINRI
jgi:tetratricopeptide (TPR) repeat protein